MINEPVQPHDILTKFDPKRARIFQKAAEIYQNGSSLREVSHQLRIPKSSIRDALERIGVKRRSKSRLKASYGYMLVSGKLVEHPLEQERIKIILSLAEQGLKAGKIAEELKRLKIPPRKGKRWCHKTIRKIISQLADKWLI